MSDNIKEISIETLDSSTRTPKDEIAIETIQLETITLPDYSYWEQQEQLDWPLANRGFATVAKTGDYNDMSNKPSTWWRYDVKFLSQSSLETVSYTWLWFTPTMLEAKAFVTSWADGSISFWNYKNWLHWWMQWYGWWTSAEAWMVWWQTPTAYMDVHVDSLDADWYTLTYSGSGSMTLNLNITAYG